MKKQLALKNWKKVQFFNIKKHKNPKKNSFQPIGYPEGRKIIGKA